MSDDDEDVSGEDWFERALREDEADAAETEGEAAETEGDGEPAGERAETAESESESAEQGTPEPDVSTGEKESGVPEPEPEPESEAGEEAGTQGPSGGETPFEEDFASALENAPEPDAMGGTGGPSAGGPGPGGPGPGGPGAGGTGGEGEGPLFEAGDAGGDDFGFADFSDTSTEEFDEEAFESDLERLDVGIEGLDEMILGGVPRRSLMVAIGSAGTGKTTFGLQFLNYGLEHGEDAVYITLEESFDRIVSTAEEKGWDFEEYVDQNRLAVVDIDPVEMANSLDSIQSDLPDLIDDFGADRLVLDSVSLLEMMYQDPPQRRSQVFNFTRALKNSGITTLMTSEADPDNAYNSRFGIVEYLADAVFVLQYVRPNDFRETRLAIEIQKIRDANHSRETKPYELTDDGISVYRQANIF
ncbi:MAG: KaiC domain-containing protein [Haloquadratum sp.]